MAVTTDIARTWRGPRRVMRDLLAKGEREDRAIVYLMAACVLLFMARWPVLVRAAEGIEPLPGQDGASLTQLLTYGFFATVMILPLMLYGIGALAHLAARALGGRGTFYRARLALFWALLAASPVALLHGLVRGFIGPGFEAMLTGALWVGVFLWFWIAGLIEAERGI
ncbi:YIP1 family protein [Histidinibacterium lentulum]|uniref:Yip1 domain-containing protein n=1 Tax=Histidinibacterium lentulum TaxID=2480588 RepID=A0A3N2R9M4_9RHOB|nr:YIP1 family protein [Histidinibacterium lentulum]ROU04107.1 hypothetical protein EAT49_01535 [Histidinibacterium lentulum]